MRIVSLLPSATETVAALGRGRDLVGRSSECDAPASVARLPAVMRPRVWDGQRSSAEIDRRVRKARTSGASLYELDVPLLARLRPELVLTQDLCGVCSVTEGEVEAALDAAGSRAKILSLTPRTLAEVADGIDSIGAALGRREAARALSGPLRSGRASRRMLAAPRVAVVEWLDPPILAGLWVPEMIDRAGGLAIGPTAGHVGERTTWAQIRRRRPDLVVLAPCSFSVERSVLELSDPSIERALLELRPSRGVWVADEAYFSRPGPRLADGIALLASLLGPGGSDRPMALQRWDPPRAGSEGIG